MDKRKEFPHIEPQEIQKNLQQLLQHEGQDGPLHQRLQAGIQEQQKLHDEIADQIRHERLRSKVTEGIREPSEKQVRRYYDQHLADRFTLPEMVHAAHIVKHPNRNESKEQQYQQMFKIKEKLNRGVPFEDLAKANSDFRTVPAILVFLPAAKWSRSLKRLFLILKPVHIVMFSRQNSAGISPQSSINVPPRPAHWIRCEKSLFRI